MQPSPISSHGTEEIGDGCTQAILEVLTRAMHSVLYEHLFDFHKNAISLHLFQ